MNKIDISDVLNTHRKYESNSGKPFTFVKSNVDIARDNRAKFNRTLKIEHYFDANKNHIYSRRVTALKYFKVNNIDTSNIKTSVKDYIIEWNEKYSKDKKHTIEYVYFAEVPDGGENIYKYVSVGLDFFEDDWIYTPSKPRRESKPKREITIVYDRPSLLTTNHKEILHKVTESYDSNYDSVCIKRSNVDRLIYFESLITGVTLKLSTEYQEPQIFINGVTEDTNYVELFFKLDSNRILHKLLLLIPLNSGAKAVKQAVTMMNKCVTYLLAVNIMSGVVAYEDVSTNLIIQMYLTLIKLAYKCGGIEPHIYYPITKRDLTNAAENLIKKFTDGTTLHLSCRAGILKYAFKYYGNGYTGVRYPKGWSNEQKIAFKAENGIKRKKREQIKPVAKHKKHEMVKERKQRVVTKPVAKHKKHEMVKERKKREQINERSDSLQAVIRAEYDLGLRQVDVVKKLGLGKQVVNKWYKVFKQENNK